MDLKDLLSDSSRRTIDVGVDFIGKDPERFNLMLNFALEDNGRFAMRAARVINISSTINPELIKPHLSVLADNINDYNNNGLRRGVLKTIAEMEFNYNDDVMGKLVDSCFQFFNDPGEEVAIRVYALEILYRASLKFPEIRPELVSCMEHELPRSSAGIRSRCKKVLKKLRR